MSDLISRRAAIKAINDLPNCYNDYSDTYDKAYIIGVLEEVPSVDVPDRKVGKWIAYGLEDGFAIERYSCSECDYDIGVITTNYCPNCGARMDGGADE